MRLKIYQTGEPVLRRKARPITVDELSGQPVQQLIDLMRETMRDAPGVGLAAPQVGVSIQLLVVEYTPDLLQGLPLSVKEERGCAPVPFQVIVNPVLTVKPDAGEATFFEGCMSVSGYAALVRRPLAVRVACLDEKGERRTIDAEGWYARILQHEVDHLLGTLYVDKMYTRSLMTRDYYLRNWHTKSLGEEEVDRFTTPEGEAP